MPSNIDITVPAYGKASTSKTRKNFEEAKTEIEALQTDKADIPGSFVQGNLVIFDANGNPIDAGLAPSGVARRASSPTVDNVLIVDANGDPVDSGLALDGVARRVGSPVADDLMIQDADGDPKASGLGLNETARRASGHTTGNLAQLQADGDVEDAGEAIGNLARRVSTPVADNLLDMDANGDPTDSGVAVSSMARRASGHTTGNLAKLQADGDVEDAGLAPSITPQYYGAIADGTNDDTTAIQNAIDAVASGGLVFFPAGRYRITSGLTNTKTGVILVGEGHGSRESSNAQHGTVIEKDFDGGTALTFGDGGTTTVFGCVVRDLAIRDVNAGGTADDGILLNDKCCNFIFERVLIDGFTRGWYGQSSCFANRWRDCVVYDFKGYGWLMEQACHNLIFDGCKAWGCSSLTPNQSVRIGTLGACNNINFYGCDFEAWNVSRQVWVEESSGVGFFGGYMEAKDTDTIRVIDLGDNANSQTVHGFCIHGVRMIGNSAGASAISLDSVKHGSILGNEGAGFATNFILAGSVLNVLLGPNSIGAGMAEASSYTGITTIRGDKWGLFGATPQGQTPSYAVTNLTTDRGYNADATTIDELADILGTLITDLQNRGAIG